MIGPRGTPLVLDFFNLELTEGLKPKVLKSAGANAKQKKRRDHCPNWTKVQGLNTHLSLSFFTRLFKAEKFRRYGRNYGREVF